MASTYTANTGIEKIGSGEQAGTWGTTTNTNFDIIDDALNGVITITISGNTTLTSSDGTLSNGHHKVLLLGGTPSGAFNLTAPEPVTNKMFSKALAKSLNRPCLFNVPGFVMKVAMGESSTMILEGQRVIPQKLTTAGFSFDFRSIDEALREIYRA